MKWKKRGASSSLDTTDIEGELPEDSRKSASVDSVLSSSTDGDTVEENISNCLKESTDGYQPVFAEQENDSFSTDKLIHM